jgi:hypothetical protein
MALPSRARQQAVATAYSEFKEFRSFTRPTDSSTPKAGTADSPVHRHSRFVSTIQFSRMDSKSSALVTKRWAGNAA